ncbi:hypothetical protein QOZ80_1AG0017910 [Eleusine coracana subsp. coracana]|nr:hypothetical protein QOZ80_1AG0017910 [Eleusine coracana subsp. coracana]
MDPNSACRVVVKVPAYVELPVEDYHVTENLKLVIDKDSTNWVDFLAYLEAKIKHGKEQELHVSFLDRSRQEYVEIAFDSALLNAFSQYWDVRKLPLQAIVHDLDEPETCVVPCAPSIAAAAPSQEVPTTNVDELEEEEEEEEVDELELLGPNYVPDYVGVDDESLFLGEKDDAAAATPCIDVAVVPSVVVEEEGVREKEDEVIDDAEWEGTEDDNAVIPIVVHDKENSVMKFGTTFSNIHEFRIAICQYAIKKEFEFNTDKSEPRRFRAHCVAKGCKWYIYAKPMMDNTTF